MYKPSFDITNDMLSKTISIMERIGDIKSLRSLEKMPILRHNNKIKSIHSSLLIEDNSLSFDQVRGVIEGKEVIGPKKDIQEVKNAFAIYNIISSFNGYSERDLLRAHKMLLASIEKDAGQYRNHAEGVFDGDKVIFVAPPENMVPSLMKQLFEWLKNDKDIHILIKSCVFHYEFVFIHPFGDGNGRMARFWQNVLLTAWNPIFEYVPLESQIKKYQNEYYEAISKCHKAGKSNAFVEFMLKVIDEALAEAAINAENESRNVSIQVNRLLDVMDPGIPLTAKQIMDRLGIKSKETLRASYLNPAMKNGLIKMTLPDKPNSKNQKYMK